MVLQKTQMRAQVIIIILPSGNYENEFKQALRLFIARFLPIPVTYIKASSLKDIVARDKERF